jgi:hypothetical protein
VGTTNIFSLLPEKNNGGKKKTPLEIKTEQGNNTYPRFFGFVRTWGILYHKSTS